MSETKKVTKSYTRRPIKKSVMRGWAAMVKLYGGPTSMCQAISVELKERGVLVSYSTLLNAVHGGFGNEDTEKIIADWIENKRKREHGAEELPVNVKG